MEKLQNLDRRVLYVILVVLCSLGLFIKVQIPVKVDQQTATLYQKLMTIDKDKTVLIQTDWTISTRGENMGHLEALTRILMARDIKFVFYTATTEAPAVEVSRDVVARINAERKKAGLREYKHNEDYVSLGLFPNAEGINQAMGRDLRKAWKDRTVVRDGKQVGAFETAALKNVNSIKDISLMVVVTASATVDIAVERLSDKVDMALMCTGVVGGTSIQFYPAQLKGIASGLKGGYEMEYMMAHGINHKGADGKTLVENSAITETIPPLDYKVTLDRANKYYATLHIALALVILAVVVGNVAMFASRKGGQS
jgi:hypothetical protein